MRTNPSERKVNRALFFVLLCALAYISVVIGDQDTLADKKRVIGYCALFAIGVFSSALPGAIIPDRLLAFNQLINTSPRNLFAQQWRRWFPVVAGLMLPPVIVALYDPGSWSLHLQDKFAYIIGMLSSVLAMGLYSFLHYYKIGPISQSWREGTSGQTWDKIIEFNPKMHPGLPRGLLPALFATARVFVVGMLPIVAMLKVDQYLPVWFAIIPGLLWLGWNAIKARRIIPQFDRIYYHTNAFYEELFTRGSIRISDRAPVSYDAVYWVPARWRAHTWASLLQFDRVLPVGRFMAIALVVYWIIGFQHPPGTSINMIFLLLVICIKNATIYTLTQPKLAPNLIEATFQSKAGWSITRFFVNLRWTMPLFIALCAIAWFSNGLSYWQAVLWIGLDITLSFVFAWIITFATFKFQRSRLAA